MGKSRVWFNAFQSKNEKNGDKISNKNATFIIKLLKFPDGSKLWSLIQVRNIKRNKIMVQ